MDFFLSTDFLYKLSIFSMVWAVCGTLLSLIKERFIAIGGALLVNITFFWLAFWVVPDPYESLELFAIQGGLCAAGTPAMIRLLRQGGSEGSER